MISRLTTPAELSELDHARLKQLLEQAFNRQLADDYFDRTRFFRVYLFAPYLGAAILTRDDSGLAYLDKFAVVPEVRGNGVGAALWRQLRSDNPQLYWRARRSNPLNSWYRRQADGWREVGQTWTVYWYGLAPTEIDPCVERALSLPESFTNHTG